MSSYKHRAWRWLAPVALVGAIGLAACGEDEATVSTRTADVGSAAGSDQHLRNQAAEIAERSSAAAGSDQHLVNQAAEIAERSSAAAGSNQHLVNQAAEIAERSSAAAGSDQHLQNQAAEIAERSERGSDSRSESDSGPNVWDAGDRATAERLTSQAEQYLEAQQERADEHGSQEEFVPGTRRMPMS
jgi:hypothetical protein